MKSRAFIAVVLATAAALLAAFAGGYSSGQAWIEQQLAANLGRKLAVADEAEVPRLIAELERYNVAGVRQTVLAMASPRPCVAEAATASLERSLDAWATAPGDVASRRVAAVAAQLALVAPELDVPRQQVARKIGRRLLTWPVDPHAADAVQVIADCEAIVRACPAARLPLLARTDVALPPVVEPAREPAAEKPHVESRQPLLVGRRNTSTTQLAEPQRFEPPPVEAEEPKRFLPPRAEKLVPPPPDLRPPANQDARATRQVTAMEGVLNLPDVALMSLLHSRSRAKAAAAEDELSRRGYRAVHLALARAVTHPDPRERLALAESLPRLPNIDPRPWLQQLAGDSDPAVRRAAESILQASGMSLPGQRRP